MDVSASLETVANDLDDATHSSMDEAVLVDSGSDPNEQRLSLLLFLIVVTSNGKLDEQLQSFSARTSLLANHPELRDKLMQAWEARSFKKIRNLSMCSSVLLS
jgi:hypothetical protein